MPLEGLYEMRKTVRGLVSFANNRSESRINPHSRKITPTASYSHLSSRCTNIGTDDGCDTETVASDASDSLSFVHHLMREDSFMNSDAVKRLEMKSSANTMKQYLLLTASAVEINYPDIDMSTEELVRMVQLYPFHEYYDRMVEIMKMEKKKNIV